MTPEDQKDVKKNSEENIVNKILENRVANFAMFASILVGVIFWVQAPVRALESKVILLEERANGDNGLQKQLQNIKDNDLHELHREINEARAQVIELRTAVAVMNNNLDILIKKIK